MSGALLFVSICSLQAQLVVKLSPQTVAEFERYANKVEAQLNERWSAGKNFLVLEDSPEETKKVLAGELFIKSMSGDHPVAITGGSDSRLAGIRFHPECHAGARGLESRRLQSPQGYLS